MRDSPHILCREEWQAGSSQRGGWRSDGHPVTTRGGPSWYVVGLNRMNEQWATFHRRLVFFQRKSERHCGAKMSQINRHADYDQLARTYDQRYLRNAYEGVKQALRGFVGGQPDLQILETGCGTGHWLEFLQTFSGIHLAGLDLSAGMLA